METVSLTHPENAQGYNKRVEITHADLTETVANTAQEFDLRDLIAGDEIQRMAYFLEETFEDESDAAFNDTQITGGDAGDGDRYITTSQVNENGTQVLAGGGEVSFVNPSAETLKITFGSMAAKSLVDIDKGKLIVFYRVAELADL